MVNAIEIERLYKSYGKKHALRGIDLQVEAGSVFGLLGPNGAGKTTIVRILATLLRPDAGSASIFGTDVVSLSGKARAMSALTGQFVAVDDILSGRENLELVGRLRRLRAREARERATELLSWTGLEDVGDQRAKTYSGGMRRRLDLAMSMVIRPRVLYLDEPTTGLDPRSRLTMWEVIGRLAHDEGVTVLLTTQQLEEADRLCSSLAVIDSGRVIARGTPNELKSRVGGGHVQMELLDAKDVPRASEILREHSDNEPTVDRELGHLDATVRDTVGTVPRLLRAMDEAGVDVVDLSLRRPTLDEAFLTLTEDEGHTREQCSVGTTEDAPPPAP